MLIVLKINKETLIFKNYKGDIIMRNLTYFFTLMFLSIFILTGCNSENNKNTKSDNVQEEENINGTYTYSDNYVELEITISGNSWSGKTTMVTGFGSGYDSQNAKYDNGTVKGNDLYDNTGMKEIGYVSGDELNISIGGQSYNLTK